MPVRFPAGFAALAAQARATYEEDLGLHARQRDEDHGWYLIARPAPPELPFSAEVAITTAQASTDLDAVALELTQLRDVEANLDQGAAEGDAYETTVGLLTWQLSGQRPAAATGPHQQEAGGGGHQRPCRGDVTSNALRHFDGG